MSLASIRDHDYIVVKHSHCTELELMEWLDPGMEYERKEVIYSDNLYTSIREKKWDTYYSLQVSGDPNTVDSYTNFLMIGFTPNDTKEGIRPINESHSYDGDVSISRGYAHDAWVITSEKHREEYGDLTDVEDGE